VINDLKSKLLQSEVKRKQLHNSLQELRGNIRVFVRCRPFLSGDKDEFTAAENDEHKDPNVSGCVMFHQDGGVSLAKQLGSRDKPQVYNFDQAYKCDSTQDEVFHDVSDLVQSSLDGYKVCVFSYGQTGSGKTHTMSGDKQGKFRGIIPRSVEQIIERVMCMREDGWEVVVNTSMLEIYNEELRDILGGGTPSTASHNDKDKGKLKISNLQGFVTIAGLTAIELDTKDLDSGMNQLEMLLERASKSRMTASTAMNEHSSRSHALFMLDIEAKHPTNSTVLRGGLRLVDLAGSERLDRTGTSNDATRLKETVNINKSLSCLADVFVALGNKASHIPYRNSKLTMALQDCLSGDGKALMFVNVSPTQASSQETLCSLRFASQVSKPTDIHSCVNIHMYMSIF
jgi:kinesin family protein C1